MIVRFVASMEGTGCLRFDGDGGGVLKLAVPASELPALARLLAYREQVLTITISRGGDDDDGSSGTGDTDGDSSD